MDIFCTYFADKLPCDYPISTSNISPKLVGILDGEFIASDIKQLAIRLIFVSAIFPFAKKYVHFLA